MMSEDEILNTINNLFKTIGIGNEPFFIAVKGLLDLYQNEKEKNKRLEIELEIKKYCKVDELTNDLINYKNLAKKYQGNCISKDKIRKCIQTPYPEVAVENIEELLEENNGKQM